MCLTAAAVIALTPASHGQQPSAGPEFVPGEVLVQFRPGATETDRAVAKGAVGAVMRAALRGPDGGLELIGTDLPVADAIRNLQALPQVEFAEPNWIVRHQATSNDPRFTDGTLWGMQGNSSTPANQFGSQAAELWANGPIGSDDVYVGIIDEGIDFNHPDLAANIWTNPFDPVDGVDNDGNGRIDDIHGWDFFQNNNTIYDGSAGNLDLDAHGTHVAGTIGAVGGNGIGVVGVNWNVTMISGKFIGPVDGTTAAAISAVEYFTDLKTRHGLNIVATNNSWGGGSYSQALHQAIIRGAKAGILFIAAAGNDNLNNDSLPHYPANYATNIAAGSETAAGYDAVISVASITITGARSDFSNFGATSVDIGAPGTGIMSTTPQNGYSSYNGTSMATPHVTGAAAIYKSMNPSASAIDIRNAILNQGIATASLSGITVTGKRLNVGDFTQVSSGTLTINNVAITEGDSGTKNATFTVSLSEVSTGAVNVSYATADGTATAGTANPSSISIADLASATPFPSNITVPAGLGSLTKVTATLSGFGHTFPSDVDVLLVGPGGQSVILMSDVGSGTDVSGVNLTFDDAAATSLTAATLTSGTYKPTNLGTGDTWASPAPAGPYGTTLSVFNGLDPAGVWKLFVTDDEGGDSGRFSGGWSLTLTPAPGSDYTATSGTLNIPAGQLSGTVTVVVKGDTTTEANETFAVNLLGSNVVISDNQGIATIVNDDPAYTDLTINAGVTFIKLAHITELRTRIDAVRAARGLAAFSYTETPTIQLTFVKAVHILELRTALAAAYVAASMTPPTYTDPVPAAGVVISRIAILELRAAAAAATQ